MFGLSDQKPLFTFSTENGTYLLQPPSEMNDFQGDQLSTENLTKIAEEENQLSQQNDIMRTSVTFINTKSTTPEQEIGYLKTLDIEALTRTILEEPVGDDRSAALLFVDFGKDTHDQPLKTTTDSVIN